MSESKAAINHRDDDGVMWRAIAEVLWRNSHRSDADCFLSDTQKAKCKDAFDGGGRGDA